MSLFRKYGLQTYYLLFCLTGLATLNHFPWIFVDEPWIGGWALEWVEHHRIALPAAPIAYADFQQMGVLFYLQKITIKLFGWNLFALRLPSFLAFCISLPLWHSFMRKATNRLTATWFVALYPFMPLVFFLSRTGRPESLILCSMAASLYFIAKDSMQTEFRMALSGGFAALGFCCYLSGAYVMPLAGIIALFFLWKDKKQLLPGCGCFALGALVTLSVYYSALASWEGLLANLNSNVVQSHGLGAEASFLFNAAKVAFLIIKVFLINEYAVPGLLFLSIVVRGVILRKDIPFENLVAFAFPSFAVMAFLCLAGRASYIYLIHLYPWVLFFLLAMICLYFKGKSKRICIAILCATIYLNCVLYTSVVIKNTDPDFPQKMYDLMSNIPENKTTLGNMDYYYYFAGRASYRGHSDFRLTNTDLNQYIDENEIDYFLYDKKFETFVGDASLKLIASSIKIASFRTKAEPPHPRGLYAVKSIIPLIMKMTKSGGYELTLYKIDHDTIQSQK